MSDLTNETLTLKHMLQDMSYAIEQDFNFFSVSVQINDNDPELIINPRKNFYDKLTYYSRSYNDDLTLKANKNIKIVHWMFSNNFDDLVEGIYI